MPKFTLQVRSGRNGVTPPNVEKKSNRAGGTALKRAADLWGLCSGPGGRAALETTPPSPGVPGGQILITAILEGLLCARL